MNARTVLLLATMAILTTGCGDTMDTPYDHTDDEIAAAAALLPTLPTLEDTEAQVTAAAQQIAAAATAVSPTLQFAPGRDREQGGCSGAFGKTGGLTISTRFLVSPTPIPDADWPRVLQAARDIAAPLGITELEVRADQPGRHDVMLYSEDGNKIWIDSLEGAVVSAKTGCRLPATRTDSTP